MYIIMPPMLYGKFQVNQPEVDLLRSDPGLNHGLKIQTKILGLSNGRLGFSTQIDLEIDTNFRTVVATRCVCQSMFLFDEPAMLQRGPSTKALMAMKDCFDLSQSHAYGLFCYYSQENDTPMSFSQLQQFEQLEKTFKTFLDSQNKIKKK